MHKTRFETLKVGDIIRYNSSGETYVIIYDFVSGFVVTRTTTATNPIEWTLVRKGVPALGEKEGTGAR